MLVKTILDKCQLKLEHCNAGSEKTHFGGKTVKSPPFLDPSGPSFSKSNMCIWKGGPDSAFLLLFCENPTSHFLKCICYPASGAQFWPIPLTGSSQISNPEPFFSKILDPVNTVPDPEIYFHKDCLG